MNKFTQRSDQEELIDRPGIPFSDWEVCLRELNTINTYLGGHAITIEGVKKLLEKLNKQEITILEIGCGGGDNLKAIDKWNRETNAIPSVRFLGVDINNACTEFAAKNCRKLNAEFVASDYRFITFDNDKPDIIFNSLFCHHFNNLHLVEMLQWMKANSSTGFFINDLHRHPLAYHSIGFLTRLFSHSYLVKNDAPISVLRGFVKAEWEKLMKDARIYSYSVNWRWAFRYLVIAANE
jgi:SAM-dependent methyltransferase